MKHRRFAAVAALLLLVLALFPPPSVSAANGDKMVYDEAGLFTSEEVTQLESLSKKHGKKGKVDIVLVTINDPSAGDCETYLEDLYDKTGFGYDQPFGDTVMLIIDMASRDVCVQGYGRAQTYIDQKRGDLLRSKITPDLSDGNYFEAYSQFIKLSAKYIQIQPFLSPDSVLLKFWFQLLASAAVGALVVAVMAYRRKTPVTVNNHTYLDGQLSGLKAQNDNYIRTQTTRIKRPTENSNGGSKSRGGGGGSGTSSGGHSHSSSSGKF